MINVYAFMIFVLFAQRIGRIVIYYANSHFVLIAEVLLDYPLWFTRSNCILWKMTMQKAMITFILQKLIKCLLYLQMCFFCPANWLGKQVHNCDLWKRRFVETCVFGRESEKVNSTKSRLIKVFEIDSIYQCKGVPASRNFIRTKTSGAINHPFVTELA